MQDINNIEDYLELSKKLQKELERKIEFYSSTNQEIVNGKYHSLPFELYISYDKFIKDEVEFCYKYSKDEFLRIKIKNGYSNKTMGHKLAVLSDFYQVFSKIFGTPTLFYTTKDDKDEVLGLEWSFKNREEYIGKFKNRTDFDATNIDKLIIINENQQLNNSTKRIIFKTIGLPSELLYLVDENIDEFIKYKACGAIERPTGPTIDEVSNKSLETTVPKTNRIKRILKKPY